MDANIHSFLYKMNDYYFLIGTQIFMIHAPFKINWYEWHKNFFTSINDGVGCIHYYVQCYDVEPNMSDKKLLYHGDTQLVYQGEEGEIRVHYLFGDEISIICEEKSSGFHIFINPVLIQEAHMYFVAMMLEKVLLNDNALILHSSYLKYNEIGILFTGPSGIGKSTQADLWVNNKNGILINGDRSVIKKDDDRWMAYGFPICGTSYVSHNVKNPIKAIVCLKQAHENHVIKITGLEAIKYLLQEISINYWNPQATDKALSLVSDLCEVVPIYLLECTPTIEAVETLYKELF